MKLTADEKRTTNKDLDQDREWHTTNRKIAEEHLQTANNIYCGMAFGEFVETELTEIIAQALAEAEAKGIEKAAEIVHRAWQTPFLHNKAELALQSVDDEIRALMEENG